MRSLLLLLPLACAGCASALASGTSTALSGVDLVEMTDRMAASLGRDPDVLAAYNADGPLAVVVEPVENRLTGEVLPQGQKQAFTARVRVELSRAAPGRFTWVMNRADYYALRGRELNEDALGPAPDAVSPRYALGARFTSLTSDDPKRRSLYYLCRYELTDLATRAALWTDSYEVKKSAAKGFLD